MSDANVTLAFLAEGWHAYQAQLREALAPLTREQLGLRAAPHLRSIDELACHIIAVRAGWYHRVLHEGDEAFGAFSAWDNADAPTLTAEELVSGLDATWQVMQEALAHFTPDDLTHTVAAERDGQRFTFRRGWVVWHVIEHDLHHGGEIGYSLGMHGLRAPDL
jgi:uncharacterized damage-inducible protein DinB